MEKYIEINKKDLENLNKIITKKCFKY